MYGWGILIGQCLSPMMYDSLFSLASVFCKSCIVFMNMSMSALGGVFGL